MADKIRLGNDTEWVEGTSSDLTDFLKRNPKHFPVHGNGMTIAMIIIAVLVLIDVICYPIFSSRMSPMWQSILSVLMIALSGIEVLFVQVTWKNAIATVVSSIVVMLLCLVGLGIMTPSVAVQNVKESAEKYLETDK